MAVAMQWVSQITSVSLMMVVPAALGYWGDKEFHTGPWLLIVGALLGTAVGMLQLFQLVAGGKAKGPPNDRGKSRD
jgi:F0F1-type ATP synthase assembly protein I